MSKLTEQIIENLNDRSIHIDFDNETMSEIHKEMDEAINAYIAEVRLEEVRFFERRLNGAQSFADLRRYKNERIKELEDDS